MRVGNCSLRTKGDVVTDVRGEQVKLGLTGDRRVPDPVTALGHCSMRCPTSRHPWLLYLPTSLWVACAKNSAPDTPATPPPSPRRESLGHIPMTPNDSMAEQSRTGI